MPNNVEPSGQDLKPHIAIIGAGFAGLAVARGLARSGYKVTLIDGQNHHVFKSIYRMNNGASDDRKLYATGR